jgi:hypothetical protein
MNEQPNKTSVAIIDTSNIPRQKALGSLFQEAGSDVTLYHAYLDGEWEVIGDAERKEFSLILWHAGDFKDRYPHPNLSGYQIFYGGDGICDDRMPKDKDRIWYPLLSKNDVQSAISIEDAKSILQHIRESGEKPSCLLPPRGGVFTNSLFILCQGYLAVWAIDDKLTQASISETRSERESALIHMGWFDLNESARKSSSFSMAGRFHSNKGGVRLSDWWSVSTSESNFREMLLAELGDAAQMSSIKKLLDMIDSNDFENSNMVALAYNELAAII